jgi:hypothetical protein
MELCCPIWNTRMQLSLWQQALKRKFVDCFVRKAELCIKTYSQFQMVNAWNKQDVQLCSCFRLVNLFPNAILEADIIILWLTWDSEIPQNSEQTNPSPRRIIDNSRVLAYSTWGPADEERPAGGESRCWRRWLGTGCFASSECSPASSASCTSRRSGGRQRIRTAVCSTRRIYSGAGGSPASAAATVICPLQRGEERVERVRFLLDLNFRGPAR